jgi:uncharacterized OB-fold protein
MATKLKRQKAVRQAGRAEVVELQAPRVEPQRRAALLEEAAKLRCPYCGREFARPRSLAAHLGWCRKKLGVSGDGPVTATLYVRPKSATLVAYLDTLVGRKPFSVKIDKRTAEQILRGSVVRKKWRVGKTECYNVSAYGEAAALIALLVADRACRRLNLWLVDRIIRAGYMVSERVRQEVPSRAAAKLRWDYERAKAYVNAWLKSDENFELPADDPDAPKVNAYKLVWKAGASKWVVQVPPWWC